MDPSAIEELFERNADMRLLELRHSEPGRTARGVRHVVTGLRGESSAADAENVRLQNAARLRVGIAAFPKNGVIPGALIGVSIDVHNDGTAPAPESTLVLSVPIEAEFRAGTLRVDGRDVLAPERLFGSGLPVPRLPSATSAKIVFQLRVLPGLNPLYLQPRLQTSGVPVVGTPGLSIKRAAAAGTRTAAEPERPFYELSPNEVSPSDVEAEMPLVLRAAPPPEPPAVAIPERLAPAKLLRVAPPSEARMSRFRTLGQSDVALLERLFAREAPGIVAHFVLISTIACNEPEEGPDATGYGEFLRADGESLGRALVLARLGKDAGYPVAQSTLDGLHLAWEPTAPPPSTPNRSPRRLRRDLCATECRAIGELVLPSPRDAQLRLRIALLALAGATLEGVPRATADECVTALASYRSAVLAWLIPLCVESLTAAATTLPQPPANVDLAARRVAGVLRAAYAT